jgi:hypothetical protein
MQLDLAILLLKLAVAPAFIALISLIARSHGNRIAGWLVALPVNTGSVLVILSITEGNRFAANTALGALLGVASLGAFATGYSRSARRFSWPVCLLLATAAFALLTAALTFVPELVLLDLGIAVVALGLALGAVPKGPDTPVGPPQPRWEIPLRMLTAALLVLTITTLAASLGPQLSGLLTPIPVFTITLVIFTHSREGPGPVLVFLHGLLVGLFSFAAFCAVAAVLLVPYGLGIALGAGLAAFVGVYGIVRLVAGGGILTSRAMPGQSP